MVPMSLARWCTPGSSLDRIPFPSPVGGSLRTPCPGGKWCRHIDRCAMLVRMSDPNASQPLTRDEVLDRLAAARVAFDALRPRVLAGEPWPLAEDFGTGPEASWGPREVLAHCAEAVLFWKGEFERLVEAGRPAGDPVPFGRASGDTMRVGILERDRTLPLGELFDRIDAGIARWEARVATATDAENGAMGLHARDGEVPATWIRDRFVVRHLAEHVTQLDELLARAG